MKKTILLIVGLLIAFMVLSKINTIKDDKSFVSLDDKTQEKLRDGDIIFQTSQSEQCEAVRIATNSKFSHCGIIYEIKGEKFVYEAVQPVKITPLKEWITHGKGSDYLVKRLKNANAILKSDIIEKMKTYGNQFNNKNYDLYFEWSDDRIYCSELVWKIYKNGAGIELCELEHLKNFNLEHNLVKEILRERYGKAIPLEEKVVAPSQLVDSPILVTVADTY